MKKIILILLIPLTLLANTYDIYINKVDPKFNITKKELNKILSDVEAILEKSIGIDFLNINQSKNAIPINFKYLKRTEINRNIKELKKSIKVLKKNIFQMEISFNKIKKQILLKRKNLNIFIKYNHKYKTKDSYYKAKKYQESYNILIKKYNFYINKHNKYILMYNSKIKKIERYSAFLSKSDKNALGVTIKEHRIIKNHFGKIINNYVRPKSIEIYQIDNKDNLKKILGHEIGHLVGLEHSKDKKSIMFPVININNNNILKLTNEDIINFKKNIN